MLRVAPVARGGSWTRCSTVAFSSTTAVSSIWFNAQAEGINGDWDGIRDPVNTRDELRGYDPEGYAFMADIYPEKTLPFPWDTNRDAYHLGETCEPLDLDPRFSYGGVRER